MHHLKPLFALKPGAVACPYAAYRAAREQAAVVHDSTLDVYAVTRHDTIVEVNSRAAQFSNCNPMGPAITDALTRIGRVLATRSPGFQARAMTVLQRGNVLFTADPPEHTRHRRVLNSALTPSAVSRIEPLIEADCLRLCAEIDTATCVDVVRDYATPAPILALAHLMGMPASMAPQFYEWATAINSTIGSALSDEHLLAALEKQIEFWDFFEDALKQRAGSGDSDLISRIARASSLEAEPLSVEQQVGFCAQLIGAGADTTTKLLAQALLTLARDPGLAGRLRVDTGLIPAFLEEILRLEPPVQGMFRVATGEFEVEGTTIPKGATLWCLYASGNRDPAIFDHPDRLDLARNNLRQHLSFGTGPHVCIGANLARAVARIALSTFLGRFKTLELADPDFQPDYEPSYVMHGFPSMPLRLVRG